LQGTRESVNSDVTRERDVGFKRKDILGDRERKRRRKSGILNFGCAETARFSVGKLARLAPAGKKLHEFLKGRRTAGIVERRRLPRAV